MIPSGLQCQGESAAKESLDEHQVSDIHLHEEKT